MNKSYLGLVIIFAVQHQVSSLSADVQHRLAHKKHKIKRLQDIQKRYEALQDPIENYDLIVTEPTVTAATISILPYRHHHHRHRSGKDANVTIQNDNPRLPHKDANTLRKNFNLTTESNNTNQGDNVFTTGNYHEKQREHEVDATTLLQERKEVATTQKSVTTNESMTLVVPLYRRVNYLNDQERNKPQKWVHCLDLVAPRLKGYKDDWRPKQVNNRHSLIKRLTELLTVDVSKYTEEEIVSVLYQISQLDLRLFQWDYSAISTILNVIITGSKHDFKTLKAGLKFMFERWHLDTSSMRAFLDQTRIFRPPCIDISGSGGYTKKLGGTITYTKPDKPTKKHRGGYTKKLGGTITYTKPDKPTKKHRGGDESCRSRETSTDNNNNA